MITEKEFNNKLFPENFWFSPGWVIGTFNHYINQYEQKHGNRINALHEILKNRNAKKLKEMWATAVFLLGYQKMTNKPHWLQPCLDNAPDALGVCFVPHTKFKDSDSQAQIFIEITEWDLHTNQTLVERIKDKLSGKSYPDYYHLVIHITRIGNINTDMDAAHEELMKLNLGIAGVWIVVGNSKPGVQDNHLVSCLYPIKAKYEFSLEKEFNEDIRSKIPPIFTMSKKQKGRGFQDFGIVTLEIPKLD
jgi:hypothetical protein